VAGVVDASGNLPPVLLTPLSTPPAVPVAKFTASVVDTGGKFATGEVDTGGKFAAGVNDTGGALVLALVLANIFFVLFPYPPLT
jgi:hypothetical protein